LVDLGRVGQIIPKYSLTKYGVRMQNGFEDRLERILTMVCVVQNSQNYWVFGLNDGKSPKKKTVIL
jgi:hypothetical protein